MHVRHTVRQYVVDTLLSGDERGLTDDTDELEGGLLDSFATTELLAFIEETFGVATGGGAIGGDSLRSVRAITGAVERAMGEGS